MKKIIVITCLLVMVLPLVGYAGQDGGGKKNADPLMGARQFGTTEEPAALVWKAGTIDRIGDGGMIVNDIHYRFAPNIEYYSFDGQSLTRFDFSAGTRVRFVLEKDLRTVVSLVKMR